MEKCRACLTTECLLFPLNEDIVYNYNVLTNLDVKVSDEMFQYICETCYQSVKYFMNFREKCILTEASLRSIREHIKAEDMKQDIDNIKVETDIDYDDSFLDTADFPNDIDIKDVKSEGKFISLSEVLKIYKLNKMIIKVFYFLDHEIEIKQCKPKRKYKKRSSKVTEGAKVRKSTRKKAKIEGPQSKLLSCGLCTKEFGDKDVLTNHLEEHDTFKNCGICSQFFRDWPQTLAHRFKHLPNVQKTCHICEKRFKTPENIEFHYRKHHFDQKDIMLTCNICSNTFDAPRKLRRHVQTTHSERSFICDNCGKIFHNKHTLRIHIRRYAESKLYSCDMCKFTTKHRSGLKDHQIRRHHPKKVYCSNCKRPFEDQESCDKHKCRKRLEFICTVCGLNIRESGGMTRHMATHTEEYRFKCTRCPKVYKTKMAFRVHQNMHEGNRTHQCQYCHAKFYHQSALIKHRRIHTGEKPYVCKICKRGFTGNYNLKVHMKIHGEYLIVKKVKPEDAEVVKTSN
ncbi:uncharacterized protein [Epargyreus clarus]|uniref:uncharacterized protein n=1 Tax=Epargyreus clarus TaxID=520877 RepID=UPI003C2C2E00